MEISPQIAKLLEAFTVVLLLCASVVLVVIQLNPVQPLGVDFAPIWAAASSPDQAYDMAAVTQIQSEALGRQLGPRPFAYPPTALLLFIPLGAVALMAAYVAFAGLGYALFVWSAMRTRAPWWVAVFPPVVLLAHVGQASLLVGALLLAGFVRKDWQMRGLLLGLAIAIKPQLCIFVPLALLFSRDWRSVAAAAAIPCALAILASAAFGISVWQEWLQATSSLREFVLSSPTLLANMLQTDPLLFGIPALLLVWLTRRSDPLIRFSAAVGAALLVSPYAMNYELALLAPGVAAAARRTAWIFVVVLILGLGFFALELFVLGSALIALLWHAHSRQHGMTQGSSSSGDLVSDAGST